VLDEELARGEDDAMLRRGQRRPSLGHGRFASVPAA
jgi:hypothetical protein